MRPTRLQHALFSLMITLLAVCVLEGEALAGEKVFADTEKQSLDDPGTTYVLRGSGSLQTDGDYFTVPSGKSSEDRPIVIILDNVNRSQEGKSPDKSFITIDKDNYVIVKLRGNNVIKAGEDAQIGSNDGMAAIHVSSGSTLKVTSEEGDGSTSGSLEARGGGGKYGGAGIGTRYNDDTGTIIIAGGTIRAYGGHCGAGIGSGRDGVATNIQITGGDIQATGGQYAAGIGAGDNVDTGEGGDLNDLTISGGTIRATGGSSGAGIGGSEGGHIRGTLAITGGSVTAQGGDQASGIGCGEGGGLSDGSIRIEGGAIKATGGSDGAGIGGGDHSGHLAVYVDQGQGSDLSIEAQGGEYGAGIGMGDGEADLVDVTLRGGTITATGGSHGAGIGAGDSIDTIEIRGTGTIKAYGGSDAAAIGAGYDHEVNDHIAIEGDTDGSGSRGLTITADSGGGTAAGIGSGSEDCGPITIRNAIVDAWGDGSAADIGTGGNWGNGGKIPSVEIENCRIKTRGTNKTGAGIGAGQGCECKSISIRRSECYGNSIGEGMGVFFFFWANYGDMDSITIEDSTIEANWNNASTSTSVGGSAAAGIGSCTLGCVHDISIRNSDVKAAGIHGGAGIGSGGWGADDFLGFEYVGGEVRNVTIENSTVEATGAEPGVQSNADSPGPDLTKRPVVGGGAGIGGGGNTPCWTITIAGSKITAKAGKYAAGIGGGGSESVDSVVISKSEVTATGGGYAAGIGCGGSESATTQTIFHADVDTIAISDSTVTATGGQYGAGIGGGCGGDMDDTDADGNDIEHNIRVSNSTVNAQGGEGGAGIGGGMVGAYATGGHSGGILLEGASHVTATGGRQGAGVGGGSSSDFQGHGGCDNVVIDLTSTDDMPSHGTDPSAGHGWLVASGGAGAAGIGAGGYLYHNSSFDPIPKTNDTQSIEIKGGYVVATGGADDTDGAGIRTGSGAGIGGGAAGTRLKSLVISGGWVEAHAGNAHAADIGHGGDTGEKDGTDDASNCFHVEAGTVVADTFGGDATKVFDGGSITAKVNDARNSAGTPVYQTTLKTTPEAGSLNRVDVRPSVGSYGTSPIYNDGEYKVYLYLPVSERNKQAAELYVDGETDPAHYYGTTTSQNDGWLKIDGEVIPFKPLDTVRYGDTFTMWLDDDNVKEGTRWENISLSGSVCFDSGVGWYLTSPGMYIGAKAVGVGAFIFSSTSDGTTDPDLYWGSKIDYTGWVEKAIPTFEFTEDPSKVYDGQPVSDPSALVSSGAPVTYTYSASDGTVLDTAPKDAGTYTVTATVDETPTHEAGSAELEFTISPAPTALGLTLSQDGDTGVATANVCGLLEADGEVRFVVQDGEPQSVPVDENGVAELRHRPMPEGEYTVVATFVPGNNYAESTDSASGNATKTTPTISHDSAIDKKYGTEQSFNLNATVDNVVSGGVELTYDIFWDFFGRRGFESAITQAGDNTSNSFTVDHAGRAVVKITATPTDEYKNAYNMAVSYVPVSVAPADLTVTSYVREKGGSAGLSDAVTTVTYGMLNDLESALYYAGLVAGDLPDSFTHGHGTLSASPLPITMGATESYKVPIIRSVPNGGQFLSRDYSITYDYKPLEVAKRKLAIQALDASGVYGGADPAYSWGVVAIQEDCGCEGLATWDTQGAVFSTEPAIALKAGMTYRELDAGSHGGVIEVSPSESLNYVIPEGCCLPGDLTVTPADLGDGYYQYDVDDVGYDGAEHRQPMTVTDTRLGKTLVQGIDYDLTYYGDLTNAGKVRVAAIGKNANYTGFIVDSYRIERARIEVSTSSAVKRYDGTALTASGIIEGVKVDSDAEFKVTGSQVEVGASPNTYSLLFAEGKRGNYTVRDDVGTLRVLPDSIAGFAMSRPEDVVYNGLEQKQSVTLGLPDGTTLVEGKDYMLSYDNATDAGTVTVTATGIGDYRGIKTPSTLSVTYEITPAPLVVDTDDATKVYDGTPLTAPGSVTGLVESQTATLVTTGSQTEVGSSKNTYAIVWDGSAKQGNYEVSHEDLGSLTVKEAEPGPEPTPDPTPDPTPTPEPDPTLGDIYVCALGDGSTWTKGSGAVLTFVYKRTEDDDQTFAHFQGLEVDGTEVEPTSYDAKAGSLVASLKAEYLEGLALGDHTLQARFDDGEAQKVGFKVVAAQAPAPGNPAPNSKTPAVSGNGSTVTSSQRAALPNTSDATICWPAWMAAGIASLAIARRRAH